MNGAISYGQDESMFLAHATKRRGLNKQGFPLVCGLVRLLTLSDWSKLYSQLVQYDQANIA